MREAQPVLERAWTRSQWHEYTEYDEVVLATTLPVAAFASCFQSEAVIVTVLVDDITEKNLGLRKPRVCKPHPYTR